MEVNWGKFCIDKKVLKFYYCQVDLNQSPSCWKVYQSSRNGLRVCRHHREVRIRDGDEVAIEAAIERNGLRGLRWKCIVLCLTLKKLDETTDCIGKFDLMMNRIFGFHNNFIKHVGLTLQTSLKFCIRFLSQVFKWEIFPAGLGNSISRYDDQT